MVFVNFGQTFYHNKAKNKRTDLKNVSMTYCATALRMFPDTSSDWYVENNVSDVYAWICVGGPLLTNVGDFNSLDGIVDDSECNVHVPLCLSFCCKRNFLNKTAS